MSQIDRIMGIPQQTKKPSSLRSPREPPAPRYINKQAAIDIARKLKLTSIGKVGLRITDKTSIDSEMISKYGEKREVSRKSIMDRAKGLETARNIKESRVGKCILEANDYESRRFGKQFGKLLEDEDQKKRQMTQKKREFVHQKEKADHSQTVTRADGRKSPLVPPPTSDGDRRHLPSIHPHGATQQHLRDLASREAPQEGSRAASRGKSPGYMRPLSCNRDKSHDSAVGETERFLNSPYMRACLSNLRDEENDNRVLESIQEAQDSLKVESRTSSAKERATVPAATKVSASPVNPEIKRPASQGMSLGNLLNSKRLKQIRELSESAVTSRQSSPIPPKTDENKVEGVKEVSNQAIDNSLSNYEHQQSKVSIQKYSTASGGDGTRPGEVGSQQEADKAPPSRGKVVIELIKSEVSSKPGTPGIVVENFRTPTSGTPDKMRKGTGDSKLGFSSLLKRMKEANESRDSPTSDGGGKQQKRSTSSLTVAAQIALLRTRTTSRKKKRAKKLANLPRSRLNTGSGDIIHDPRFTQLASSLIPDSSLATDLYRSSGQFSVPDHVANGYRSNVLRVKDGLRQSRNLHNLKRFEALFESW